MDETKITYSRTGYAVPPGFDGIAYRLPEFTTLSLGEKLASRPEESETVKRSRRRRWLLRFTLLGATIAAMALIHSLWIRPIRGVALSAVMCSWHSGIGVFPGSCIEDCPWLASAWQFVYLSKSLHRIARAVATTRAGLVETYRAGRLLRCPFRGLLSVHSSYGLHACRVAKKNDPLQQRLQQSRCLPCCSDCYRAERTSSRTGLTPAADHHLFTAH